MTTAQCIVKRILELCMQHNLTPHALARSAAVSPSTAKSILNGASKNPGIVTIKLLCDGLDISLTEFFDTDDFRRLEQEIR